MRTMRRVRYSEAALTGALADPEMCPHVALLGDLFPRCRGSKVTTEQLSRALAACHPSSGKRLRKRVNAGLRREGDSLVSNVCYGFDIPLAVDKSVSIAALTFRDDLVLKIAMDAMRQSARWLSKKMDRRLRRGGQNATSETGKSAVFFIPEKAGRDGQPQLHAHLIIPNLTTFKEEGRTRCCAGHFRRITRSALEAQQRMNRQLSRNLQKAGYAVEVVDGVCRLPSVPRALCEEFSPVSARMKPAGAAELGLRRRYSRAVVRRRENLYLEKRARKVLQPLTQWQTKWGQVIGADRLKAETQAYLAARYRQAESKSVVAEVAPFAPEPISFAPVIAAARIKESAEDVLEDSGAMRPSFGSLGAAFRKKLETELSPEARNQVVELDYVCTERARHLVEHTEALRTLLRLIFPRLIVHQKFSAAQRSSFKVTGAAAANPKFAQLIVGAATALEVELGQDAVRANWPAVLRWLHAELANRPPEPVLPAIRRRPVRRVEPPAPIPPSPPVPTPTPESPPAPTIEPDWEMLP
jgi:conjugative relaxase-like TrwC/TraI family protein